MATRSDKNKTVGRAVEYTVLTPADRLAIAREYLRSREDEHYRRSLATPPTGDTAVLDQMADNIDYLRETVVAPLEAEVGAQA